MPYTALSDDTSTLSQFTRRKVVTITTNGTSTPANYQVKLTVTYESEMQADFDDVRFNTIAGGYIDYWIESYVTSTSVVVWIELPDVITDPGSGIILMYYGNPSLSNGSNGYDAFLVFDDFEDALQGDWTTINGSPDYANTEQKYSGSQSLKVVAVPPADRTDISIACTSGNNYNIQYRIYKEAATTLYPLFHGNGTNSIYMRIDAAESILYYDTEWHDTGADITPDNWELLEIRNIDFTAGTYDIYLNNSSIQSAAGMIATGGYVDKVWIESGTIVGEDFWIDNFIVRKYIANEPSQAYGVTQHQRKIPQFIG
jgi:hypothetical protein